MKFWMTLALLIGASSAVAGKIDTNAVLGGAIGGGTGAAVGSAVGGKNGAIIGSAIGAAAGTAIAAEDDKKKVKQATPVRRDRGKHKGWRKHRH